MHAARAFCPVAGPSGLQCRTMFAAASFSHSLSLSFSFLSVCVCVCVCVCVRARARACVPACVRAKKRTDAVTQLLRSAHLSVFQGQNVCPRSILDVADADDVVSCRTSTKSQGLCVQQHAGQKAAHSCRSAQHPAHLPQQRFLCRSSALQLPAAAQSPTCPSSACLQRTRRAWVPANAAVTSSRTRHSEPICKYSRSAGRETFSPGPHTCVGSRRVMPRTSCFAPWTRQCLTQLSCERKGAFPGHAPR